MAAFCRDCLRFGETGGRCRACGSPRLLRHPERDTLSIAHIDCDAFYASIEKRDDPRLADRPVIIGGGKRGVVATCCYIARTFGVRSAMPLFKARAMCPDAAVVRPNMEKYAAVGRQIRGMMRDLTPLVEPLSIDEAFVDLTGADRLHGAAPAVTLARFARRIETEVGVTVSVGLSYCKFLAKLASDLDKPRGFSIIGRAQAQTVLAPMPIGKIWGVGAVAEARLQRAGLMTIGDLQTRDETELLRAFGPEGVRLGRLARGIDPRRVTPHHETKSISAETTFEDDVADPAQLASTLYGLCEKVAARLKKADFAAASVTLKLKTADFKTRTRSRSGLPPTNLAARLFPVARDLLAKETGRTRFRLIGFGVSDLRPGAEADAPDLAEPDLERMKAAEDAIDRIRARYGARGVFRGVTLNVPKR